LKPAAAYTRAKCRRGAVSSEAWPAAQEPDPPRPGFRPGALARSLGKGPLQAFLAGVLGKSPCQSAGRSCPRACGGADGIAPGPAFLSLGFCPLRTRRNAPTGPCAMDVPDQTSASGDNLIAKGSPGSMPRPLDA
jgi:hypothetical protein